MRSEELGANLFRITQTEAVLREDNIIGENNANKTHYDIGKNIRETIKKIIEQCQKIYQLQKKV